MRYLVGLVCVLALGVMGCSETAGTGGSTGQVFACNEQGIRDAIAEGGGPHTFGCGDPQTVVTEAPIEIDNDVILDGEGNLTVDGNDDHEVFFVPEGVTAELHGLRVTGGFYDHSDDSPERSAGVYNAGTLTITNSTVSGNRATLIGVVSNLGTLSMTGVTVSDNACEGCPAIQNAGTLTMTNCTLSGNTGDFAGGTGIGNSGTLTMTNCTVSRNAGAAISIGERGLLSIANTIVDGECAVHFTSGVASFGFNIESPGDTCRFHDLDQVNVTAEQLNLGPLQDNGGPTQTHALLTEPVVSVAIETAWCLRDEDGTPELAEDQRGVARPQGDSCDVGAFEFEQEDAGCQISARQCIGSEIAPIEQICEILVPDQASACDGTESIENPTSCMASGNTVTYKLTQMQIAPDCNTGYDLDDCTGSTCSSPLAGPDGANGVDNALNIAGRLLEHAFPSCADTLGRLDQAFHSAICTGGIDIEIEVDAVPEESCAVVTLSGAGVPGDPIPMNLSDDGCLSGTLGTIPIGVAGVQGAIENAVVRMTVSTTGFSDGVLGGTAAQATAGAMFDEMCGGSSAVVAQVFDINADLPGNSQLACDSLSMTLEIGGSAIP